jgi:hypothetical protein
MTEIEEACSLITASVQASAENSSQKIETLIRKALKEKRFIKSRTTIFSSH